MTPENERLVRESWSRAASEADALSSAFYDRLFTTDPALHASFAHVDMEIQRRKFAAMMADIVGYLDDPGRLVSLLAASGRRHAGYGADAHGYEAVGSALLWALERTLGTAFTAATRDAWMELYAIVAGVMQRAGGRPAPESVAGGAPPA